MEAEWAKMGKKSKEAIEIEFNRAINQAKEIEEVAKEMVVLASNLNGRDLMLLEQSWKGSNADAIATKWKNLTSDMIDTSRNLENISRSIRATADLVYKAEKAAMIMAYY